jgi:hypothetical protein
MLWVGITFLVCAAMFLELASRAPSVPDREDRAPSDAPAERAEKPSDAEAKLGRRQLWHRGRSIKRLLRGTGRHSAPEPT